MRKLGMPATAVPLLVTLLSMAAVVAPAANLPRPSPDFAINAAPGKQLKPSQYKGHPVVLIFILTYCAHCQKSIGFLIKDQQEFGPRGLQVLASAIDLPTAVPGFIKQFNPPFPVGFNSNDEAMAYLQHAPMMTMHMPAIVLIDKDGVIRAQYEGDDPFMSEGVQEKNLHDKIEELMKTGAPAGKKTVTKKGVGTPKKQSN
jgi:peroxiredoxin